MSRPVFQVRVRVSDGMVWAAACSTASTRSPRPKPPGAAWTAAGVGVGAVEAEHNVEVRDAAALHLGDLAEPDPPSWG
jgi:hypothetical protein